VGAVKPSLKERITTVTAKLREISKVGAVVSSKTKIELLCDYCALFVEIRPAHEAGTLPADIKDLVLEMILARDASPCG
jgi:hypothetical protein